MTHRATLNRPSASTDAWNRPGIPSLTSQGTVSCRVYRKDGRLVLSDDKTARVDELRVMFPSGTDVRTEDRLSDISDREGTLLYDGPFVIRAPMRHKGHQEARLEGHGVGD